MAHFLSEPRKLIASSLVLGCSVAFACGPVAITPAFAVEKAVAPETNPPGDIPDTQVFVTFSSKSGFSMKVPEGWARTETKDGVSFIDKLDGVVITETTESVVPTLASLKKGFIPYLEKQSRAFKLVKVEPVKLPAGAAFRITFSSNSDPNAVTNKQVRLENAIYIFHAGGKTVSMQLYAPYGADNADQWNLMSRSFKWN
jgi:hypothetical protein